MKARLYGDVSVKSVEEKEYAFYVTRKLNVTHSQVVQNDEWNGSVQYNILLRSFYQLPVVFIVHSNVFFLFEMKYQESVLPVLATVCFVVDQWTS